MLIYEELGFELKALRGSLDELSRAIDLEKLRSEIEILEKESSAENFWNDLQNSQKVLQDIRAKKNKFDEFERLNREFDDIETMIAIADESGDETFQDEISTSISALRDNLHAQKLATLLTGEYDGNNAILTFHAGAGGTEAQDWAQMLYRLYTRWSERRGFMYRLLDYLDGDEAGLKSASILIEGQNAYGYLKSEVGVHRLVRVSPFDSSGRRHTSFASLEVMPEIPDDVEINIRSEDLKVDTYRAGGAGGQHVNKTESAVRITHIPSGIVVACQNERSQHQNREVCMKMLRSKLVEVKEREHLSKIEDIKGVKMEIAWGSQIRSYVFMPYTLVKDHRTDFEMGNVDAVMDGDIDGFINAYLEANAKGILKQ